LFRQPVFLEKLKLDVKKLLPTGQWNGFYIESHKSQRGWMHQYLEFADDKMTGEGTDYVGPWTLTGVLDLVGQRAKWVKHYVGKHDVNYSGKISGKGIVGVWDIRGVNEGPFHIWPQHMTEFDSMYMQEELDNTPLRQSPPRPRELDRFDLDGFDLDGLDSGSELA
jgi:hypothetical protein